MKSFKLWDFKRGEQILYITYVNIWGRRESWGRLIGDRIKFLRVMEGFPAPLPNAVWAPALLFPASIAIGAACFAGDPTEMSKWPEFPLFCLVGHISSLGPGVSGAEITQSARNKSTCFGKILLEQYMIMRYY